MIRILANCSPGETRAVAWDGALALDYAIHRPGASPGVGARLRGRVSAHIPAMAGAFVTLPPEFGGLDGFLPDSQGAAALGPGDPVGCIVTRAAQGSKGPRLAAADVGPGPPAVLEPGPDAIDRLLALHPGAEVLVDDPAIHPGRAMIVAHAWDDAVEAAIEALSDPVALLEGGLVARIHPTPALVAIDIDTAAATAERRPKAAAQREANRAALPALAQQIRLRNLSGAILVDLAGMAQRARTALGPDVAAALATDPLRPRFLGFTALGLAEISRPRAHPPLHELLAGPHAAGLAALRRLVREAAANPATPFRLRTTPDIARALQEDAQARIALARRAGRPLLLLPDPGLPPGAAYVEPIPRG